MIQSYYVCPDCRTPSAGMKPLPERHDPTPAELRAAPMCEHIGHEVLGCPCGRRHTWFSLVEVAYDVAADAPVITSEHRVLHSSYQGIMRVEDVISIR
jgi:hypothetical protein